MSVAPKRIAIVGTAVTTLHQAPYNDPSWEVWGLNALYTFPGVRWDRWFELHSREHLAGWLDGRHWKWLTEQQPGKPLYMRETYPECPAAVAFPVERLLVAFPSRYYTNTVSYMIALAMLEGATEIGVWGVDMATSTEYGSQRPSCEFWLGLAMGAGIRVTLPKATDLLQAGHLYALEDPPAWMAKLKAQERAAAQKAAELEALIDDKTRELEQYRGGLQTVRLLMNNR